MTSKRIIAFLLCIMMLCSLLPAAAFAEGEMAEDEEIIYADDEIVAEDVLAEDEIPAAEEASDEEIIPEAPAEAEEPAADDEIIADDEIPSEPEAEDDENELGTVVASGTCGDNLTWSLDDANKLTISGSGAMAKWDNKSSEVPWYSYRKDIKSVSIAAGVTNIGDWAFYGCEKLEKVIVPTNVTSIGKSAFESCSSLTSITIPSSVTSIAAGSFSLCSSLTKITVASGNLYYKTVDGVLFSYDGKTIVKYPEGLSETEYSIPSGVTRIEAKAFHCALNLIYITIPNGVTSIGEYAFCDCSITKITLPKSMTSIGECAFYACGKMQTIIIPESITSIGNYAFEYCQSLTSITIPRHVTSIGEYAFYGGYALETITFEGNAPSFGKGCFFNVYAKAYYPVNDSSWTSDKRQDYGGKITWEEKYPSGKCGDNVYWALDDSGKLTISGSGAMYDYVTEDPGYEEYKDQIVSIEVKSGVTKIGACDFYTYKALTSVTLANTVTDIGASAFEICRKLTSITIPESVTSIGNYAFSKCSALTTIYFTGDAPSIGTKIFSGVIATAYYPSGNSTWTSSVMQQYGGTITWKANGAPAHGTPVISSIDNHADYMIIRWGKVEGATSYKLAYRAGSGSWQTMNVPLSSVDGKGNPRVNLKGLTTGTTYTFIAYANFSDGTSTKSASATQVRLLSPKVTVNKYGSTAANGGFKVSWNATEGGSCYKIYYREKGGSWALYAMIPKSANTLFVNIKGSVTNANANLPNLVAGKTYEFAVLTATSQTNITSGFPTSYTGYKF